MKTLAKGGARLPDGVKDSRRRSPRRVSLHRGLQRKTPALSTGVSNPVTFEDPNARSPVETAV